MKEEKKLDYISDLASGNKQVELKDGSKIEIRKPKVKDIRLVKHIKDDEERELNLIMNLAMKTESDIDDMDFADYQRLQSGLASFLS